MQMTHMFILYKFHQPFSTQQPTYLVNLLHFCGIYGTLYNIRFQFSSSKTKLNIGKRAYSVAAPTIWNQLHIAIKSFETIGTFRMKLKTYLFEIALTP